ncbi:MAG: response regulator transcription factor, partial [Gammaproteobacteria bacterium]
MHILLVEDDPQVLSFISKGMKEAGHIVDTANSGKDGLFLATTQIYDVIVIDRMLPEMDGLTIIKTMRGAGNITPVLILSALGEVDDRVEGLRAGGDDYLVKPFAFSELLVRVEIISRRQGNTTTAENTKLQVNDLELDLLSRKVKRAGKELDLKAKEFQLLEYLLRHKGQVVTRTMLLEHVWDY